ncbi:hypothetical protein M8J77_012084 [Diaphorina citri]|nr:hypothetical protein M8J77_012084 [Diaphorina citri]
MNVPERDVMGKGIVDIQHHYATCNISYNEYNRSNIPAICRNFSHEYINDNDVDAEAMERMVSIIVPIFFGIIIILGFFGNALVVVVVAFNQQMRSTTNLLIINLAIADLLFIVCCVPFTATDYVTTCWPFGDVWCKMVQYLIVVTAYASVYTLVLMSLDRFLAVVHPIASMSVRTERNALKAILITWIVIVLAAVPVFNMHGEVSYTYASELHTACVFLDLDPVNRPDGYNKTIFQKKCGSKFSPSIVGDFVHDSYTDGTSRSRSERESVR